MYNLILTGNDMVLIRKAFGFTQKEFAKIIDISAQYVSDVERKNFDLSENIKTSIMVGIKIKNQNCFDSMIVGLRTLFKLTGFETIQSRYIISEMILNYIQEFEGVE